MSNLITPYEALLAALERAESQAELARIAGCSTTAVWKWFKTKRVGVEYVLKVEAATGVSRHLLRPDIYPPQSLSSGSGTPILSEWDTGRYGAQSTQGAV